MRKHLCTGTPQHDNSSACMHCSLGPGQAASQNLGSGLRVEGQDYPSITA